MIIKLHIVSFLDRIDSVVDNSFKSLAGGKQPLFVETSVTVTSLPSYRLDESSCRKVEAVVYPVADLLTQKASIPFRRKGSAWETHKQRKETTYMQLRSTARCPIVMSRTNDGFFGHFATHQTNLDKAELYLPSLRRCTKTAYHEA